MWHDLVKLERSYPATHNVALLGGCLGEIFPCVHKKTCTRMLITALLPMVKNRKDWMSIILGSLQEIAGMFKLWQLKEHLKGDYLGWVECRTSKDSLVVQHRKAELRLKGGRKRLPNLKREFQQKGHVERSRKFQGRSTARERGAWKTWLKTQHSKN